MFDKEGKLLVSQLITGAQIVALLEGLAGADRLDADAVELIDAGGHYTATDVEAALAEIITRFNANTILAANADNTPLALTIAEQRLVGRITGGNIAALTAAQVRTLINVENGSTADQTGAEIITLFEALSAQKWNQQFNNLLKNGSFESWSAGAAAAPDGWTLTGAGAAVAREATIIKFDEYSAKVTRSGTDCYIQHSAIATIDADTNTYWRDRIVTLGCWVYATVADRARIQIGDNIGGDLSALHPGDSAWHFLTVTYTINAAATAVIVYLRVETGNTDAYFDGAILVEGTIAPTYAPKAVEHVAGWQAWVPTLTGGADLSGYDQARFCVHGKTCYFYFTADAKNVTTANDIQITLPFTSANTGYQMPTGQIYDGTAWVGQTKMLIAANTNYIQVFKTAAGGNWAGTENGVYIWISGFYEIA